MTICSKLKLVSITHHQYGHMEYKFRAQYDDTIPEDKRFQKATPNAMAEFTIDNPAAADFFKLGNCYYFDAIEAPE